MSIVSLLKGIFNFKLAEPDLIHPVFGGLYSEVCGDEDDFWQSETIFEPLKCEICINIIAGAEGPSDAQVEFFLQFSANYSKYFDFVEKSFIKEFEEWFQIKLTGDFLDNFLFNGVTIPKNGDGKNYWEISFECLADKNRHLFTAEIENGTITNIRADG